MTTAIYARVSTEDQATAETIQTQVEILAQWLQREGRPITGRFLDDGVSGATPFHQRPAGAALLRDASAGKFQAVAVYMLDRLGRDPHDVLGTVNTLRSMSVEVISPNEQFANDPSGRLYTGIRAVFAGFERDIIRERTVAGRRRSVNEGHWSGGRPPYGYRIADQGNGATLAIDPESGPVVESIYRYIGEEGFSLGDTARKLDAQGLASPKGAKWCAATISRLIRNPTYKGEFQLGWSSLRETLATCPVPPIVPEPLWIAATEAAGRNRRLHSAPVDTYILTGILRCECGGAMVGKNGAWRKDGTRLRYYGCTLWTHRNTIGHSQPPCFGTLLPAEEAESAVAGKLEALLGIPAGWLRERIEVILAEQSPEGASAETDIRRALEALRGRRSDTIDLHHSGIITRRDLADQLQKLDEAETRLETQLVEAIDGQRHIACLDDALQKFEAYINECRNTPTTDRSGLRRRYARIFEHITALCGANGWEFQPTLRHIGDVLPSGSLWKHLWAIVRKAA